MSSSRNGGANQYGKCSKLDIHPELPNIIQGYLNTNHLQKDLPALLKKDHGIVIGLRTIQDVIRYSGVKTVRKSGLTPVEKGVAILELAKDDPLSRWGCRLVQEKLAKDGTHISRDFIMEFRRLHDPESSAKRHPITRKSHKSMIWSLGPNEEWCIDGHEKIFLVMGIAIWGIIDKFSRKELGLWAIPNARLADVPPVLYLQLVRKLCGMPVTTTADKGSELAKLIPLVTTLRQMYQPFIDEETLPAMNTVKSIYNVTRERSWRPLWEKELGNIRHVYVSGKIAAGFHENDPLHVNISYWLWGAIVQACLDEYLKEQGAHRVRRQEKSLLPTGGRRNDFYERPEEWGGEQCLINIPSGDIDLLLEEYNQPDLLRFGSAENEILCHHLYRVIGCPALKPAAGWNIFQQMITVCLSNQLDTELNAEMEHVNNIAYEYSTSV